MLFIYFLCYIAAMKLKVQLACSDMGYQAYAVQGNPDLLFKPFVNVYFGAAYLKWLSSYDQQ